MIEVSKTMSGRAKLRDLKCAMLASACVIAMPITTHAQSAGQGAVPVKADDLISDSGFESGALTAYPNSSSATIDTLSFSGAKSARMATVGNYANVSQPISSVIPGEAYTGIVMARTSDPNMPVLFRASQSPNGPDNDMQTNSMSWRALSVDFTGSYTNQGKAYIYCSAFGVANAVANCDDMHVYRVTPLTVTDSGFETGTLTNWEYSNAASVDGAVKHTGDYSVRLLNGGYGWASTRLTVKPNSSYVATAWFRTTGSASVSLQASLTNSGGWYRTGGVSSGAAGEWVKETLTFTTGTNDTDLHLYCGNINTAGDSWCDDFQLRELKSNLISGSATAAAAAQNVDAGYLRVGLNSAGTVVNLIDTRTGINYAAPGKAAPLVSLVINGSRVLPTAMSVSPDDPNVLVFSNTAAGCTASVLVEQKVGYAKLTLIGYTAPPGADVQTVLWGPLSTTISDVVGEAVGNVRERNFTMGIKPLNSKTEAGWPNEMDGDPQGYRADIQHPIFLQTYHAWQYQAAQWTNWGSLMSAFTFDYTKPRVRTAFWPNYPEYGPPSTRQLPVDALAQNGDILYSTIALYGSDTDSTMTTLSTIAKNEGLPYLTIDGQWQKVSQAATDTHLVFFDLGQSTLNPAVTVAKTMGLDRIYSLPGANGPWVSGGTYQFNSSFGGSDASAAAMAATAASQGVKIGVHTLSTFIDTWDPLVTGTPPNRNLATGPRATLTRPLDATSTTVFVSDNTLLDPKFRARSFRIGDEFLEMTGSATTVGNEVQLTGVLRGRFGSTASSHASGDRMSRMIVNEVGGFSANLDLMELVGQRIADLHNVAGMKYHSFDGLEDVGFTGYGARGFAYHVNRGFYDHLVSKEDSIVESSQLVTNIWDTTTRISWGEVGKTSALQRQINRRFYSTNLMPNMLGWISLDKNLTLPHLEQIMAEGAGVNAGSGFQTWVANVGDSWPNWPTYFAQVKQWEAARNLNAFSPWTKAELLDLSKYWHLATVALGQSWNLQQTTATGAALGSPIAVSAPAPALSNAPLPVASTGKFYQANIKSNALQTRAWTLTSGALPAGIALNKDTGGLMGVPTAAGTYNFTVTADNGLLAQASRSYTIIVQ